MHRFALLLLLLASLPASAQDVHSDCIDKDHKPPSQCGVIEQPKILNVYWDTSAAQWDIDAAATTNTQARIDAHLQALTRSTYFSQLGQYHVGASEFLGSVTSSGCLSSLSDPQNHPIANLLAMALVLDCVRQSQPQKFENVNLVVLLLPPQVTPAWITASTPVSITGALPSCAAFSPVHLGFDAFHVKFGDMPTAIIPLQCLGAFSNVFGAITHEIVEAMTNADPIFQNGYVDRTFGNNFGQFGSAVLQPEISDLCETKGGVRFLDGLAAPYWSQADKQCVSGFDLTRPTAGISSVALCGGGRNMRINVQGTALGGLPQDASSGASLYFGYEESAPSAAGAPGVPCPFTEPAFADAFQAGHLFGAFDSGVTVRFNSWNQNQVSIGGFAGTFGTPPRVTRPGDRAVVQVANPDTGTLACFGPVTLPAPTRIAGISQPAVAAGGRTTVNGIVMDGSAINPGCGHEGIAVTLTASAGSLGPMPQVSDADGQVGSLFHAPDLAGKVTITASGGTPPFNGSWTVDVAPVVSTVAPLHVDKAGGTRVTITGRGFVANATSVTFNGVAASPPQVQSATQLIVEAPPSATTGAVLVGVSVHDIPAFGLPQVIYVPALGPYLTFSDTNCGTATVTAEVFDHDGTPVTGEPVVLTAVSGSFVTSSGVVATLTVQTGASGRATANMATSGADPTGLALSAHTRDRPTPDESASVRVIATATCDRFRNVARRNLRVRIVLGEELISSVVDGCRACVDPSRFRVQWQTSTPILNGLAVTALTDDATIARNLRVTVLGADKAGAILKGAPVSGQAVTLVELAGALDKARVALAYADAVRTGERVTLYRLNGSKWIAVAPIDAAAHSLAARVSAAGTYAIVAR
jgi:hypothetical protein